MAPLLLHVDARADLPDGVAQTLRRDGYTLRHTADPEEAMRLMAERRPALVLMELDSDDWDGLDLMAAIRDPQLGSVPVLALTRAPRDSGIHGQAIALGVAEFLTKPARPEALLSAIREIVPPPRLASGETEPARPRADLAGDLSDTPMPELLARLHRRGANGVLAVGHGDVRVGVQLRNGSAVGVSSTHREHVAEVMLYETFRWEEGRYAFSEGLWLESDDMLELEGDPAGLLLAGVLDASPTRQIRERLVKRESLYVSFTNEPETALEAEGVGFSSRQRRRLESLGGADTLSVLLDSQAFDDRLVYALWVGGWLDLSTAPTLTLTELWGDTAELEPVLEPVIELEMELEVKPPPERVMQVELRRSEAETRPAPESRSQSQSQGWESEAGYDELEPEIEPAAAPPPQPAPEPAPARSAAPERPALPELDDDELDELGLSVDELEPIGELDPVGEASPPTALEPPAPEPVAFEPDLEPHLEPEGGEAEAYEDLDYGDPDHEELAYEADADELDAYEPELEEDLEEEISLAPDPEASAPELDEVELSLSGLESADPEPVAPRRAEAVVAPPEPAELRPAPPHEPELDDLEAFQSLEDELDDELEDELPDTPLLAPDPDLSAPALEALGASLEEAPTPESPPEGTEPELEAGPEMGAAEPQTDVMPAPELESQELQSPEDDDELDEAATPELPAATPEDVAAAPATEEPPRQVPLAEMRIPGVDTDEGEPTPVRRPAPARAPAPARSDRISLRVKATPNLAAGTGARRAAQKPSPSDAASEAPPTQGEIALYRAPTAEDRDEVSRALRELAQRVLAGDDFAALGITASATDEQVRAAYDALIAQIPEIEPTTANLMLVQRAKRIRSRVEAAYANLGNEEKRRAYSLLREEEEQDRAAKPSAERALEGERWFRKGKAHLEFKRNAEAIEAFGMASHLDPQQGEYASHLGYALYLANPTDEVVQREAMEHLATGIKRAPKNELSYVYLGRILKSKGDVEAAKKVFQKALRIKPDFHPAVQELRVLEMRERNNKGVLGRLLGR